MLMLTHFFDLLHVRCRLALLLESCSAEYCCLVDIQKYTVSSWMLRGHIWKVSKKMRQNRPLMDASNKRCSTFQCGIFCMEQLSSNERKRELRGRDTVAFVVRALLYLSMGWGIVSIRLLLLHRLQKKWLGHHGTACGVRRCIAC